MHHTVTKTLASKAMEVVIDNNQPKTAVEEMAAETATAMVKTTTMARAMATATAMAMSWAMVLATRLAGKEEGVWCKRGWGKNVLILTF